MIRSLTRSAFAGALVLIGCATSSPLKPEGAGLAPGRCRPAMPCWPTEDEWQKLRATLVGRLEKPVSPLQPCVEDAASAPCALAISRLKNPFYLQDQAGGTESLGWLGAWNAAPSAYAVAVETPGDVVAAVKFARAHRLRLVIKGAGHDYLGRSNAPDSLLVWTHEMRRVTIDDTFVAHGCTPPPAAVPAVIVEAGARWIEAYDEVTVKHHRYVQGGGCASVGAAGGFLQGGGFGAWSKKYGIAAAGLLEAEVVTANGDLVVANACQNEDLFWALRGGGGGTFGVVTKATLMTHALPNFFGAVHGTIKAKTDAAFKDLIERFLSFYSRSLSDEHWGDTVYVRSNNSLKVGMSFEGMSADEAKLLWDPFRQWVDQHSDTLTFQMDYAALPAEKMWDAKVLQQVAPDALHVDERPDAASKLLWWASNDGEVATYWYTYQSRWIPLAAFQPDRAAGFAQALFDASRQWSIELHFHKGQAGASAEALRRDRETSVNPAVYKAAALAILAADATAYPGVRGYEPNVTEGEAAREHVTAAMKILRAATPGAGSYVNETDYFEPNWQEAFWGENYPKLLAIKRKYDPDGFFVCHHCVGSEEGTR
jgi:FAD/FMN-containing dehydrogenase